MTKRWYSRWRDRLGDNAELLLLQRNSLNDCFELREKVGLPLPQVLSYEFVFQKFSEISLCQHQIQHVLSPWNTAGVRLTSEHIRPPVPSGAAR
jgi:hypothetical protein